MNSARRSAPDAPRPPGPLRRVMRRILSPTGVALLMVVLLAVNSASISYSHMFEWAKLNGDVGPNEWRARLFPLSVDGAVVAALAVLFAALRAGRKADPLAYWVSGIGLGWSVFANIAHDWDNEAIAKLISAWPALALGAATELLMRLISQTRAQAEAAAAAEAERQRVAEAARAETERQTAEAARAAEEAAARRAEVEQRRRERAEQREAEQREVEKVERQEEPQAQVVQLRATGTDGATERPTWLPQDATAEQAMHAYLATVNPSASGADLDREVGIPYFNTRPGYGRKVARAWRDQQDNQQKEV